MGERLEREKKQRKGTGGNDRNLHLKKLHKVSIGDERGWGKVRIAGLEFALSLSLTRRKTQPSRGGIMQMKTQLNFR